MAQKIVIKTESNSFEAELNDSMTGKAIYGALPIHGGAGPTLQFSVIDNYFGGFVGGSGKVSGAARVLPPVVP